MMYKQNFDEKVYVNSSNAHNSNLIASKMEITNFELGSFVGNKKRKYYLKQWNNLMNENSKSNGISRNWCAAVFGPYWGVYRKMYKSSIIMSFLLILGLKTTPILLIISMVAYGLYGNLLYLEFAKKNILKLKKSDHDRSSLDLLQTKGGTNISSLIIFIIVMGLATYIF